MGHINTGYGEHDFSVSGYIIRMDGNEPRLLLHRHKKLGMMMQFGGHIEKTEHPWAAILHELEEESGYTVDQLHVMQPNDRIGRLRKSITHPVPLYYATFDFAPLPGHNHTDVGYLFLVYEDPAKAVGEGEVSDNVWLTEREVMALQANVETFENVQDVAEFAFSRIEFEAPIQTWEAIPASEVATVES